MTDDLQAALRAQFGDKGLWSVPGSAIGLPLQVGPYFEAPEPSEPALLGDFAALLDREAGPLAGQLRVGYDRGAQLYVAEGGAVRALVLGTSLPELAVNSSVEAFAAGLLLLDRHLPAIGDGQDGRAAFAAYQQLRQGLVELDPAAFADRESWWPRVLDDLRRPLNTVSSAAFEFVDEGGEKRIVTAIGGPGMPHPEEMVWHRLRAAGVEPEQITQVYCELEPCVLPGHYCSLWMADVFTGARFTHSFDYGRSAESREEGVKALMISVAERQG
ncbi:nucleic acid/nucleotide deaminase domain-containing protein [Kitasatospora sp. McL0602]|uniref:nucleic acid/nucleotide deaminase domain-containing protein n=1 Tax=Kitasatospora sp. McL0602 TaxID=3439530 RepID=UPI003F8C996C